MPNDCLVLSVDLHSHCALIEDGLAVLESLCERDDARTAREAKRKELSDYESHKQRLVAEYSGGDNNSHYLVSRSLQVTLHNNENYYNLVTSIHEWQCYVVEALCQLLVFIFAISKPF